MSEKTNHQPTPPDEWYEFTTVGERGVRVGYSKALVSALGDQRKEIRDKLGKWSHFSTNVSAEWSPKKLKDLKADLDRLFLSATGASFESVLEKEKELQNKFDQQENPLQVAIESGLTLLYRGDE